MQTMERTTGREIDVAVTEWDPENPSLDPAEHVNPPAVPLLRTVTANRDGVKVYLGEVADRAGDMSELHIGIYTSPGYDGSGYGAPALEGTLKIEQIEAMIELLQSCRLKAEAVFIPR
ncbi:MAG TPA: hypothetical protein VES88_16520 [Gemmatimonadaceae bacterium]|nr:hypothetical protein [Gemmatimonadaceae bacterium]